MATASKPHGNTGNKHARGHGRPPVAERARNRSIKATDAQWSEIQRRAAAEGVTATQWLLARAGV